MYGIESMRKRMLVAVVVAGLCGLHCGDEPQLNDNQEEQAQNDEQNQNQNDGEDQNDDNNDDESPLPGGWHSMTAVDSPTPRSGHFSVWTGDEKIVWGGFGQGATELTYLDDGGIYDPDEDEWREMSRDGAPRARLLASAVWTGDEMIVWGGGYFEDEQLHVLDDGAAYDPDEETWRTLSEAPIAARGEHATVWTGEEMIVWGGGDDVGWMDDGAAYDPEADEWRTISAPAGYTPRRTLYSGVWTGDEMLVWGGLGGDQIWDDGWRYDPEADEWTEMETAPGVVGPRAEFTTVWTGDEMVVWGGVVDYDTGAFADGAAIYDPEDDSWSWLEAPVQMTENSSASGVWADEEAIFWGGTDGPGTVTSRGVRVDPVAETVELLTESAPTPRSNHSAVWSGSEMLVFGGIVGEEQYLDDGWLFVP